MDRENEFSNRLTELESSMMHLQNDYDALNDVVLENARRLDRVFKSLERLKERLDANEDPEPPRDAEDEKPPHY